MDANGLTFFQLADGARWREREHVRWDAGCRALALASERALDAPISDEAFAVASGALDAVPRAADAYGAVARWEGGEGGASAVVAHSHLSPDAVLLPLAERPSDLAVGADGVLYVAQPGGVTMHDLRGRFDDAFVTAPAGFAPWRLDAATVGGATVVWLLERSSGRLARLVGRPLPALAPRPDDYAPGVFRPSPENCRPPRIDLLDGVAWPAGERPLALAAAPDGRLALLSWGVDGTALLRTLEGGDDGAPEAAATAAASLAQTLSAPVELRGARYAYSLAWLDASRVALRLPGRRDAPAFDLQPWLDARRAAAAPPDRALALGEVYPLAAGAPEAPFAHRVEGPPRYAAPDGGAEPLLALSIRNLARRGSARHWRRAGSSLDAHLIDSGQPGTVWHRLVAEASIPPGTGFVAWVAASADPEPPDDGDPDAWQPHAFGADVQALAPDACAGPVPRAAWDRAPSELPGHPGLAPWTPERDRRGLFGVLIQDAGRRVRRITGRYLWLRVELYGDGRATPEIVALRAWAGRFDYALHYLPRLYRETLYGAAAEAPGEIVGTLGAGLPAPRRAEIAAALDARDASAAGLRAALAGLGAGAWGDAAVPPPALAVRVDAPGARWRLVDAASRRVWHLRPAGDGIAVFRPRATPADFLSRLLANFEGVLTTLEDRVAAAHLATDPATVPEAQLDWLAGWIGVAFDPVLPAARRRAWLAEAPRLARWHGTRRGLSLALDVATGGGVAGGEIVVVEDFRLRRLLATLLGVDLSDEGDPLLPGPHRSGNSVVGDSLVLGDLGDLGEEATAELLALFRADVAATAAERDAVLAFLGRLAHRATVLVHAEVEPQDLGLIRRVAELEAPAHVEVRVEPATWPLLVGVASLVGVDTYLGPPRRPRAARVQVSALGMGDVLLQQPTLDPRLAGTVAPPFAAAPAVPPTADAGADRAVPFGDSFELDAGGSRAAPGRRLDRYVWRRLPPDP